jgi:phage/plasmid-like protein (TIGR03299 family)
MAHQIETNGTEAAAIFARTDPWHRLGTTVRGQAFSAEEAMTIGHLGGWRVRKAPLIAHDVTADGVTTIDAPGYATVRDNPFTGRAEALGVVGAGYEPLQNEDHAEFLNNLADQSGAVFDTAGSLRGGRQVFITMQLPESLAIGGTDAVDLNIAALNSHDGSGAFRILVTPVRVVCANTQAAALAAHASSFSIRHTRNAKAAVAAARDALGLTFAYVEAFEAEAERLIQTTLTDGAFDALIEAAFGPLDPDASERTKQADADRQNVFSAPAGRGFFLLVVHVHQVGVLCRAGTMGMPRLVAVRCIWTSLCSAAARLVRRPSTSPSQPRSLASAMRSSRLLMICWSRSCWAGSGRSIGQRMPR